MASSFSRKCPDLTFLYLKSFAGRVLGRVHLGLPPLIREPDQSPAGKTSLFQKILTRLAG
jgi:hypothetical protein